MSVRVIIEFYVLIYFLYINYFLQQIPDPFFS